MSHNPCVAGVAPQRLDANSGAVEELTPGEAVLQGIDVANEVDGVAVRTRGVAWCPEIRTSRAQQVHQGINAVLACG
jgi:hypothetical protein